MNLEKREKKRKQGSIKYKKENIYKINIINKSKTSMFKLYRKFEGNLS
jgi:hypothetical protein